MPLGARRDRLSDVPRQSIQGIQCEEVELEGESGVKLSGIFVTRDDSSSKDIETVLVYFQGNAGNPLHRIPLFQHLLRSLSSHIPKVAVLAVAPRSYWKSSSRRPTQAGITKDYCSVLRYALQRFPTARITIYGHSLGGAAAICVLHQLEGEHPELRNDFNRIRGLILENPFSSIPAMVRALYPQKWLPYHHLAPLAFDKWDAVTTLATHVDKDDTVLGQAARTMLILLSEHDEIVPIEMGTQIFNAAMRGPRCSARRVIIPRALHENAWNRKAWTDEVKRYLHEL